MMTESLSPRPRLSIRVLGMESTRESVETMQA